jgi:hypothetical protein
MDRDGFISNGELYLVLKQMVGNNLKVSRVGRGLRGGRSVWHGFVIGITAYCVVVGDRDFEEVWRARLLVVLSCMRMSIRRVIPLTEPHVILSCTS